MKADQLSKARNPLLPAAMIAIQRAAQRARREAHLTHTAIIIAREGKIERLALDEVRETPPDYGGSSTPVRDEDDS